MKIIEGLKQTKDLAKKLDDLRRKINLNCVRMDYETPMYGDNQSTQVREWIQAYGDIVKKTLELRLAIQKTNLTVNVTIELDGVQVTKSIAAWIHRRKDLAKLEKMCWDALSDRNLKEGSIRLTNGEMRDVKIVRHYDPVQRDNKVSLFDSEPSLIDAKLEIVNAVTDLILEE